MKRPQNIDHEIRVTLEASGRWLIHTVYIPRRSITGKLLWGRVWRRRKGARWIYKRFTN
jgi:hypothetical protein